MESLSCSECQNTEVFTDPVSGEKVCMKCGKVLSDVNIVSCVEFQERPGGSSGVIGQFVDQDGGTNLLRGFRFGGERKSRQMVLQAGKAKIEELCTQLNLPNSSADIAFGFYKLVVDKGMTRGRTTVSVTAACVYISCRLSQKPIMLLDISDLVQVNVFVLGRTYNAIKTSLHIQVKAMEPLEFLQRFCNRLEFGARERDVCMTAYRLVQRMQRDYLQHGRRPAGLCGAAILVAARIHNFSRTEREIIQVVKVCEGTVKKRLKEFAKTASSKLTVNEFGLIDIEEAEDPPSFVEGRKKAREEQQADLNDGKYDKMVSTATKEIEKGIVFRSSQAGIGSSKKSSVDDFIARESIGSVLKEVEGIQDGAVSTLNKTCLSTSTASLTSADNGFDPMTMYVGPTVMDLGLNVKPKPHKYAVILTPAEQRGELDLTGIDDDEIEALLLPREAVLEKSKIWYKAHKDYLIEQKKKAEERAEEEKRNGPRKAPVQRRRRKKQKTMIEAATASEAVEKMLQEKKLSSKINYDVLKTLEAESMTAATHSWSASSTASSTALLSGQSVSGTSMGQMSSFVSDGVASGSASSMSVTSVGVDDSLTSGSKPSASSTAQQLPPVASIFNTPPDATTSAVEDSIVVEVAEQPVTSLRVDKEAEEPEEEAEEEEDDEEEDDEDKMDDDAYDWVEDEDQTEWAFNEDVD